MELVTSMWSEMALTVANTVAKDTVSCFYVVYLPPVWNLDHLMMSANLDMRGIIIKCSHRLISWSNVYRFIWFYIISFVECRALSRVYVAGADHKKLSQQFHGGYRCRQPYGP